MISINGLDFGFLGVFKEVFDSHLKHFRLGPLKIKMSQ